MIRTLRWIAAIGLGGGLVSLIIAFMIGGYSLRNLWERGSSFHLQACGDGKATPGASSERRLAWTGGDKIEIAVPATVRLRMGEGSDIVVRGSPEAISRVDVRGNRLSLDCRWQGSSHGLDVTLPGKALRQIGISGWARLDLENLNQPELALRIRGSGNVRASGTVDRLSLHVSGSGHAQLADLALKTLELKISGSGDAEAAPKEEADVSISGSGTLRLLSRPARLKTHISGSGRVLQPTESSERK